MEKDFETRKKEYIDKLRENTDILNSIKESDKETVDILVFTKNERQLLLAEHMFTLIKDMFELVEDSSFDFDGDKIDLDSSMIINLFVELILAFKNNDTSKIEEIKTRLKTLNMKDAAKMTYETIVIFTNSSDEALETIADKCGFDLEDELSIISFQHLFEKANEITKSNDSNLDSQNIQISDDNVEQFIEYSSEFHALCEEGKLDKGEKMVLKPNNNQGIVE
jgi:hypothetical protein